MQHFSLDRVPSSWRDLLSPGRRIAALAHDAGAYRHTETELLFDDGGILRAAADEHRLGPLFDCFTLELEKSTEVTRNRASLSPAFEIEEALALIRDEWLVPATGSEGAAIGRNPHVHESGPPGSAPEEATVSATCLAGVLLVARDRRQMGILVSVDVPLNVDIVSDPGELAKLVGRHRCQPLPQGRQTADKSRSLRW